MMLLAGRIDRLVSFVQFAVRAPFGVHPGAMSTIAFCAALCAGCGQQIANAEQPPTGKEPETSLLAATPGSPNPEPSGDELASEGVELRRGYGVVDMRSNACVTRKNERTFAGGECPPGFVIYGPYVAVPADAEVEVAFNVRSNKQLELYADIVSRMGTQTLAGLNRQRIEPGPSQKLGYRVHIFSPETNVESRIGVKVEPGTEFEIADLTMTVR